jgi:hypothetical protein
MTTVTLSASADYGHTGQYVARLTGRDSKFTFEREFIGTKYGKRNEGTSAEVDDPGVYEMRDVTRKGKIDKYRIVVELDGELHKLVSDKEDAMAICKQIDAGRPFADIVRASRNDENAVVYEILTAKQAEQAAAASVVDQCVALLAPLDDKAQKAALTALRAKLASLCKMCRAEPAREGKELGDACWRTRGSLEGE